ncbi:MAG: hypothetical protein DCF16_08130 [Alphaproteobacteria bacterium]|nr:MAG: hypothetical protein DCF16_08130 [Alphaproteobacteria bacterium]
MIDVRIICTHDAAKLAETLTRLLEAEEHRVRLTIGRQAMGELQGARETKDAVVLIWSPDARSQTFMLEWARQIDATRVIDITLTPDWPRIGRKVTAIDFAQWRGDRSERAAWNALNDRLRGVARAINPPKPPPKYATLALGLASAAAMTGAVFLRMNDVAAPSSSGAPTAGDQLVAADPDTGLGGPVLALEPASVGEWGIPARNFPDAPLIRDTGGPELMNAPEPIGYLELRDATFLERLSAINPLRDRENETP